MRFAGGQILNSELPSGYRTYKAPPSTTLAAEVAARCQRSHPNWHELCFLCAIIFVDFPAFQWFDALVSDRGQPIVDQNNDLTALPFRLLRGLAFRLSVIESLKDFALVRCPTAVGSGRDLRHATAT